MIYKRLANYFFKKRLDPSSKDISNPDRFNEFIEQDKLFWSEKYPRLSLEEKKKVWEEDVYKSMRIQGEALGDEYSAFSRKWYAFAKKHEPQFDAIFKEIIETLEKGYFRQRFNWDEYYRRIEE